MSTHTQGNRGPGEEPKQKTTHGHNGQVEQRGLPDHDTVPPLQREGLPNPDYWYSNWAAGRDKITQNKNLLLINLNLILSEILWNISLVIN